MEDKKKNKEDKRKRETYQSVPEQKIKVPDPTDPPSSQQHSTPGSVSSSTGPIAPSAPCPGAAGVSTQVPPGGGNNAKQWTAVANGQPSSPSKSPNPQQQHYMSREVPPRFRCQPDHKVLLKKGQPLLSSMLLGGGVGGEGAGGVQEDSGSGTTPPPSSQGAENPNANAAGATDSNLGSSSPSPPNSSSSSGCVTDLLSSSTTTTCTTTTTITSVYANSTWGTGSICQSSSQGCGKVTVDGTDVEGGPSIQGGAIINSDGVDEADGGLQEEECPGKNNNISASWSERSIQQKGEGGAGNMDNPSQLRSSPCSFLSLMNECVETSGGLWGSSTSSPVEASETFHNSKVSCFLPGPQESPVGGDSDDPVANFDPSVNPALPEVMQDGTSLSTNDSLHPHSSTVSPLFSTDPSLIITPPSSSVNETSIQSQYTETAEVATSGEQQQQQHLDSGGGAGPNQEGVDEKKSNVEVEETGGHSDSLTSSSADPPSWRHGSEVTSDSSIGALQADGCGGGGTGVHGQEENVWGVCGQKDMAGWGKEDVVCSSTPVVSQGVQEDRSSEGEGESTTECLSSTNLAIGSGGACGIINSSSSGGTNDLQDSTSPKSATVSEALDNQKGTESGDELSGVLDKGEKGEGTGCSSSSNGGESQAGSGGGGSSSGEKQEQAPCAPPHSNQTSTAEVALQSMMSRSDLDPRVLSNTGWGQTKIRQNVPWDMDTIKGVRNRNDRSTSSSSAFSSRANSNCGSGFMSNTSSVTNNPSAGGHASSAGSSPASLRENWDGGSHISGSTIRTSGMPEGDTEGNLGKGAQGWGECPPEKPSKGWGNDERQWGDHRGNRRDNKEQGIGWSDAPDDKGKQGWKGTGRGEGGGWGGQSGGGGDWGQRDSIPGGGWRDGQSRGGSNSGERSSWSNLEEVGSKYVGWSGASGAGNKSHQDWGSAKAHSATVQIANNQGTSLKAQNPQQHQSQGQQPAGGPTQGGWKSGPNFGGGGPPSKSQNQSSGWISGPIPKISGSGGDTPEPSGWEEPSPQSISRKMEIDDGTSAWGDPAHYISKNVSIADKNIATSAQTYGQHAPQPQQLLRRQHGMQHSRDTNTGNASAGAGTWGGGIQSVDNGTAAWNQATDTVNRWGDPDDTSKTAGWGQPTPNPGKPGTKPLKSWGEMAEDSAAAPHHSSCDKEVDGGGGGTWNSTGSHGVSSSFNSGGWHHNHGEKRGNMKSGGGDSWMNTMPRQFSHMSLMGDEPSVDKKPEGDKRGMTDYNGDMRRGARGGGYRMQSSKEASSVDMGLYNEKMGGQGAFIGGSGGMAPPRGIHQPGMHPFNTSHSIRAQVPHQFLSAQVPGPVLKQMPNPAGSVGGVVGGVGGVGAFGGIGGGLFPPPISPQQLAMFSNISPHMQQFHLAFQLLLQQQQQQQLLQNQLRFPQPQGLQPDPQQLARIVALLQQQRHQHGGVGGTAGGGNHRLSPSHLGRGLSKQPMVDPFPHTGMGVPLPDLQSKQGMYSGLGPGGNLSAMDMPPIMGGIRDTGGQQSRFRWMMEGHSPAPSPPDTVLHKNGPVPNVMKGRGGSPHPQYEMLSGEGSAETWHRTPGSKMGNKPTTSSWPPEFQPGVPWKGMQNSGDPESDPYITPSSVLGSPGPTNLNDSDHQLLRANPGPNPSPNTLLPSPGAWPYSASDSSLSNAHSTGKYSEYKPSWPPEPIGQSKFWKTNRNSSQLPRPPPGLTNQKQTSPSPWDSGGSRSARGWGGGGANLESRFGPGSAWSDDAPFGSSCWLLLSNLTPQIDGSTLRTICVQHGPLLTFHLGLTQGSALIRYNSRQEAAKAQCALHMCVLGNTTILAEFLSEEEVVRYFAQCHAGEVEGAGSVGGVAGGLQGSAGAGTGVASSRGSSPGSERAVVGTSDGSGGRGGDSGTAVLGSVRSPGSGWQSLDGTGSSIETSSAKGPGLGIYSQWSTNGAAGDGNVGGVEPARSGLWGGMTAGYPSGLWGAPPLEERHQLDSPAALLPGDLLGSGGDSI